MRATMAVLWEQYTPLVVLYAMQCTRVGLRIPPAPGARLRGPVKVAKALGVTRVLAASAGICRDGNTPSWLGMGWPRLPHPGSGGMAIAMRAPRGFAGGG